MHIGAHVSPAGGPAKAVERGAEAGADSIQIFNQSPRMWRGRETWRPGGRSRWRLKIAPLPIVSR